jgi:integrase
VKPNGGQRFSGHSLRAGLATAAEVDERYVQKQLGHTRAEMTRRYPNFQVATAIFRLARRPPSRTKGRELIKEAKGLK